MKSQIFNIYNLNSAGPYIYGALESFVSLIVTYLEFVLISTIVISIKSVKRKIEYNKDYMIIFPTPVLFIKFSNNLIKEKIENAKIAFSTTNYHVFRAGNIASEQNLNYEGIGAKTKIYFWINAFIREFIATLYTERKKHFIIILSIIINVILAIIITYINNNI